MSIIIGKKHHNGVMFAYDTANLEINDESGEYKITYHTNKVHQISTKPWGIAMAGVIDLDYLANSDEQIGKEENLPDGIDKFLQLTHTDEDLWMFNYCAFIFADANGFLSANISESKLKDRNYRDHAGIGHGLYPAVKRFLYDNKEIKSQKTCAEELGHAINLSKEISEQDPLYKKGFRIKGFGLVNITKDKYEILAFSED